MPYGLDGMTKEEITIECRRRAHKAWETIRRRHPPKPKKVKKRVDPERRRSALKAWETIRANRARTDEQQEQVKKQE